MIGMDRRSVVAMGWGGAWSEEDLTTKGQQEGIGGGARTLLFLHVVVVR